MGGTRIRGKEAAKERDGREAQKVKSRRELGWKWEIMKRKRKDRDFQRIRKE